MPPSDKQPLCPFIDYPARDSRKVIVKAAESELQVKVRFGSCGIYLINLKPPSDVSMKFAELSKTVWR